MLKQFLFVFSLAAISVAVISTATAAEAGLAAQISNERGVKVTVIPKSLSSDAKTWDFDVVLETHTQPLNEDLAKISTLVVDGKQYSPLMWEGAPPGGHHRKGMLRFKAIMPQPPSLELQIRLTGEAAPRGFKWIMKGASHGN